MLRHLPVPPRARWGRPRPSATPRRERPRRPSHHLGAVAAVVVLTAGLVTGAGGEPDPDAAVAAVTPMSGFAATVAGWTSWYGAYGLADLGWAWCIDHGSSAPDPDLVYAPTSIAAETDPDTRAAMAWAVTMNPPHDPVTAAAIMLALHDLRRAHYPFGPLEVERLGPTDLAGFDGAEAAVLDRARAIRGDAWAHAHLRQPFSLSVEADRAAPRTDGAVRATLTDANGAAVGGVAITLDTAGAALTSNSLGYTAADGSAWFGFRSGDGENRFAARADLPRTEPEVFAPTRAPAQRVIIPAWATAEGVDAFAPAPTTTSTTSTTSTTRPPTTTTTTRPVTTTTTTRPPSTTTTTTTPETTTTTTTPETTTTTTTPETTTTSTTTTAPTTTSSTTAVLPPTPPPAPPSGSGPSPGGPGAPRAATTSTLPRTGRPTYSWALIGTGSVLCGSALVRAARRRSTAP